MLGRLLLLFLAVLAADLALLVSLGGRLGVWPTLALIVTTAAAGSWLARREGARAWRRVQERLALGTVPGPDLLDGLIVFAAGVLLVAPGFLTDVVGLLGLAPPTRALVRRRLIARWTRGVDTGRIRVVAPGRPPGGAPPVEDAEVVAEGRRPTGHQSVASARL